MRIENGERRRGRLARELAERNVACAPFEATLAEAEPDRADPVWERWRQATINAREKLDEHERRRGFLRKVIAGIDDELSELRSKLDE